MKHARVAVAPMHANYPSQARTASRLVVQHDAQKGSIDFNSAVVSDKTQLLELVHEQIDSRARCADHFGQRLLRYLGEQSLGVLLLAVARKQQKRACEPLLGGVE